jgi:hypothetical protein
LATGRVELRLAAILAADMAGYSRLMGMDEGGTLALSKTRPRPSCRDHEVLAGMVDRVTFHNPSRGTLGRVWALPSLHPISGRSIG